MGISERLTQQQLLEVVLNVRRKGEESEITEVDHMIAEIKRQILHATASLGKEGAADANQQ